MFIIWFIFQEYYQLRKIRRFTNTLRNIKERKIALFRFTEIKIFGRILGRIMPAGLLYAVFLEMINLYDIFNDHILAATLITLSGLFRAEEETDDHIYRILTYNDEEGENYQLVAELAYPLMIVSLLILGISTWLPIVST